MITTIRTKTPPYGANNFFEMHALMLDKLLPNGGYFTYNYDKEHGEWTWKFSETFINDEQREFFENQKKEKYD